MSGEAAYRRRLREVKRALRPKVACLGCGRRFKPTRTDQRFHSKACKQRAYRTRTVTGKRPSCVCVAGAHEAVTSNECQSCCRFHNASGSPFATVRVTASRPFVLTSHSDPAGGPEPYSLTCRAGRSGRPRFRRRTPPVGLRGEARAIRCRDRSRATRHRESPRGGRRRRSMRTCCVGRHRRRG